MKRINEIEKEITSLLKEAEVLIIEKAQGQQGYDGYISLSFIKAMKRTVKDQFSNIRQYLDK